MVSTLKYALIVLTFLVAGCSTVTLKPTPKSVSPPAQSVTKSDFSSSQPQSVPEENLLVTHISLRYKKDAEYISSIVSSAEKYAYTDFPTKSDILAIIAVESGFNNVVCHRGSCGLMQIELKSHRKSGITRYNYKQVDTSIRIGSKILREYFLLSHGSKRGAFLAYNAGIGNYLRGHYRLSYYRKIVKAKKEF